MGEGLEAQAPLEPEVLERFPRDDYEDFPFPIPNQLASFCFPLGVRVIAGIPRYSGIPR